jgi:hypothetical protein
MNKSISCVVLAVLAGCAATPNYDARFGDAVRDARLAMRLNPAPSADRGIDGQTAQDALTRYRESFKTPPPVVNVINIGGSVRANGQ